MTTTPHYKKTATKSGDTVPYSESTRSIIGLLNNIYVGCYCLGFKIQIVIHSPFFMKALNYKCGNKRPLVVVCC